MSAFDFINIGGSGGFRAKRSTVVVDPAAAISPAAGVRYTGLLIRQDGSNWTWR